ncbi:MAG: ATP-binding cassette domain-containing protein [Balneolaceae bacterium]
MLESIVVSMNGVTVQYGYRTVLDRLEFTLDQGEFCYLIGKTGAGKSSFLKLLYRDIEPDEGSLRVAGLDLHTLPEKQIPILRRRLGIVFQDFQLLPDRNVYDNIAFALEVTGHRQSLIKERALEVLGMVGLSHRRKAMPDDLSGGEQQRVVIARALANEPRILLADEPTGNLDPEATDAIMKLLQQINRRGMAILMVTHDYETVRHYPARTIRIADGKLEEVSKV